MRLAGLTIKDIADAVSRSNAASAGHLIHKGNAEYVVRGVGWIGASSEPGDDSFDPSRAVKDLENVVVFLPAGGTIRVADVAEIGIGPGFRRGVLEKDGNEVTGGVVLMAHGENPLEVTRRIKAKIRELQTGLPHGVRIVPFYDRTPLIEGAIGTVTQTVIEAIVSASLCVLIVLLHVRTSLIIASTIPLAALSSFLIMAILRRLGLVDIQANIMSLAGIAISIGVLVDSSVVMAENVMHRLRERFGSRRGARRRARHRLTRVPGGRQADRLLGRDHGAFVSARVCTGRNRGEDVSPARLYQDVCPRCRRALGRHAGAGALHCLHSREAAVRARESASFAA